LVGPVGHCGAGQLGAVVAAQHRRIAALAGEQVKFVDEFVTGPRELVRAL